MNSSLNTREEEVDGEGTWAISYGDMVTLLLCFFLLFFSVDSRKSGQKELQDTLVATLAAHPVEKGERKTGVSLGVEKQAYVDEVAITSFGGKVQRIGNRILVSFANISFFNFSETELTKEGLNALRKFAKLYLPFAGSHILSVKAYTDNKKVTKKSLRFRNNLELSALRSVSGMQALQLAGIPLNRMRLGGQGVMQLDQQELESLIRSQDKSEKGLALARKIVLTIEPTPKELDYAK